MKEIEFNTLPQILSRRADLSASRSAVKSGSYSLSYSHFWSHVSCFAAFLNRLKIRNSGRVVLIGDNSCERMIAESAVLTAGYVSVPLPTTVTGEELVMIASAESVECIIIDNKELADRIIMNSGLFPLLRSVIYLHSPAEKPLIPVVGIHYYEDVLHSGKKMLEKHPERIDTRVDRINQDSPAFILFSSISERKPKGVILSHRAVASAVRSVASLYEFRPGDIIVSALPAHIAYSIMLNFTAFTAGLTLAFSALPSDKLGEDFRTLRPDIFAAMPEIWEKIYTDLKKRRIGLTGRRSLFVESLIRSTEIFNFCLDVVRFPPEYDVKMKSFGVRCFAALGLIVFTLPQIVFSLWLTPAIRKVFGGRISCGITGNRHIHKTAFSFFRAAGIKMVKSYGYPETCGILASTGRQSTFSGADGRLLDSVNYKIINKNGENVYDNRKGRLYVQAPFLMSGYTTGQEDTNKVLYEGWFDTGDIARIMKNGFLVVYRRVSNIVKMSHGAEFNREYAENLLESLPEVVKATLSVNPKLTSIYADIVPDPEFLKSFALEKSIDYFDFDELLKNGKVRNYYWKIVKKTLTGQPGFINAGSIGTVRLFDSAGSMQKFVE